MFFFLSKLLAFLLMPFTWAMFLLVYAWITKEQMRRRRALIAGVVVLLVFSNRMVFDRTMHQWEIHAIPNTMLKHYDAVIVLGGTASWEEEKQRIQFNRSGDRLFQALSLWKQGYADKLVFSGGSGSILHPEKHEGEEIRTYLLSIGVPDSVIVIENESKNTHENAAFLKPILKREVPGGKYLLITSGYHMRRSLACFAKEGIPVTAYSTDRYSGPPKFEFDYAFIPCAETMFAWEVLIHEWFGCISYKLAGYI